MKKYRLTCTHNPQDFFNGDEPPELLKSYNTLNLEANICRELQNGYVVIVSDAGGEWENADA